MQERYRAFKGLLLAMGRVRRVEDLLALVVARLVERPSVALARLWLVRPGDICDRCHMADECPDRARCLHLVASAGQPRTATDEDWSRLDGHFRRFPLGARMVGHVAATGEPIEIADVAASPEWFARTEWVEREGIRGFGGQPLQFEDDVLGVLAVFSRVPMEHDAFEWMRMIADHAAGAIVNARAFEEIERLRGHLELENTYLREEVASGAGDIIGESPAIERVRDQIEFVAPTDATVLITGESGVGKELVAREIHRLGSRRDRPMIRVNCASIPEGLFESEFFGHARGAFTGAVKDHSGRFAAADGGTLFLDEVGEIPLGLQSKLLRVLQERTFERVGEERTRTVDARVVAATNRDLAREVEERRFREDLFYRLNVFPLEVPPLRRRREDVPRLAEHFLALAARRMNRPCPRLGRAAADRLEAYPWPGNVRELMNAVERSVIVWRGGPLRFSLPGDPGGEGPSTRERAAPADLSPDDVRPVDRRPDDVVGEDEMNRRMRANLLAALERASFKVSGPGGAAELLGVKPTTLGYRMRKFGIERPRRVARHPEGGS